jgi:hypothetical protein
VDEGALLAPAAGKEEGRKKKWQVAQRQTVWLFVVGSRRGRWLPLTQPRAACLFRRCCVQQEGGVGAGGGGGLQHGWQNPRFVRPLAMPAASAGCLPASLPPAPPVCSSVRAALPLGAGGAAARAGRRGKAARLGRLPPLQLRRRLRVSCARAPVQFAEGLLICRRPSALPRLLQPVTDGGKQWSPCFPPSLRRMPACRHRRKQPHTACSPVPPLAQRRRRRLRQPRRLRLLWAPGQRPRRLRAGRYHGAKGRWIRAGAHSRLCGGAGGHLAVAGWELPPPPC